MLVINITIIHILPKLDRFYHIGVINWLLICSKVIFISFYPRLKTGWNVKNDWNSIIFSTEEKYARKCNIYTLIINNYKWNLEIKDSKKCIICNY